MSTPHGHIRHGSRLVVLAGGHDAPAPSIPVRIRRENTPDCPLCGALTLLSAHVPHRLTGNNGLIVDGTLEVALCARCHTDDPAARPLIEFFRDHPEVTDDIAAEFADLLRAWVTALEARGVNLDQWQREYDDWVSGDL